VSQALANLVNKEILLELAGERGFGRGADYFANGHVVGVTFNERDFRRVAERFRCSVLRPVEAIRQLASAMRTEEYFAERARRANSSKVSRILARVVRERKRDELVESHALGFRRLKRFGQQCRWYTQCRTGHCSQF
jgi:hypothetical protein